MRKNGSEASEKIKATIEKNYAAHHETLPANPIDFKKKDL